MHGINLILSIKWAAALLFHGVVVFGVLIAAASLVQGLRYNYGGPPTWNVWSQDTVCCVMFTLCLENGTLQTNLVGESTQD